MLNSIVDENISGDIFRDEFQLKCFNLLRWSSPGSSFQFEWKNKRWFNLILIYFIINNAFYKDEHITHSYECYSNKQWIKNMQLRLACNHIRIIKFLLCPPTLTEGGRKWRMVVTTMSCMPCIEDACYWSFRRPQLEYRPPTSLYSPLQSLSDFALTKV